MSLDKFERALASAKNEDWEWADEYFGDFLYDCSDPLDYVKQFDALIYSFQQREELVIKQCLRNGEHKTLDWLYAIYPKYFDTALFTYYLQYLNEIVEDYTPPSETYAGDIILKEKLACAWLLSHKLVKTEDIPTLFL